MTDTSPDPAGPTASRLTSPTRSTLSRRLALAAAGVFTVSLIFPITAALSTNTAAFPEWWGPLDVTIAFLLAILAIAVLAVAERRVTPRAQDRTYRAYRVLQHGVIALIVVFFLAGDRITWSYGLLGLAWRGWLLLYSLPAWFTALEGPAATPPRPAD